MRWMYPSCLTSMLDMCVQLCNYFEHKRWCPHVCIIFPVLLLNWWHVLALDVPLVPFLVATTRFILLHPWELPGLTPCPSFPISQAAAQCVCWHLGEPLSEFPPASVTLAAITYSLLPLVPSGASHPPIAIPFSFLPILLFLLLLEYSSFIRRQLNL